MKTNTEAITGVGYRKMEAAIARHYRGVRTRSQCKGKKRWMVQEASYTAAKKMELWWATFLLKMACRFPGLPVWKLYASLTEYQQDDDRGLVGPHGRWWCGGLSQYCPVRFPGTIPSKRSGWEASCPRSFSGNWKRWELAWYIRGHQSWNTIWQFQSCAFQRFRRRTYAAWCRTASWWKWRMRFALCCGRFWAESERCRCIPKTCG